MYAAWFEKRGCCQLMVTDGIFFFFCGNGGNSPFCRRAAAARRSPEPATASGSTHCSVVGAGFAEFAVGSAAVGQKMVDVKFWI